MPTRGSIDRFGPLLLVAAGGFAGATMRYGVAVALPATFPWGTLAVNVAGALICVGLGAVLVRLTSGNL